MWAVTSAVIEGSLEEEEEEKECKEEDNKEEKQNNTLHCPIQAVCYRAGQMFSGRPVGYR